MSKGKNSKQGPSPSFKCDKNKQTTLFDFFEDEKTIAIEKIKIGKRIRSEYSNEKVEELAESISEIGLMNPVVITKDNTLVAGYHRILAFKKLGKTKIPYRVTTLTNPLKLQLQEIDENLVRGANSYLEECEQILKKKEIYEELYPETKKMIGIELVRKRWDTNENSSLVKKSFSKDTAEKMNVSQRTIQNKIKIAESITSALRNEIRQTKLANRATDLLNFSKFSKEYQKELLETMILMKKEGFEIETLKDIKLKHEFYEMNKQNDENSEIIEMQERQLDSVKTYIEDKLASCDSKAYELVQDNGVISWERYKLLHNTTLWREGKRLKFLLNELNGIKQPKWENTAFHHENPYPWEHLFSEGHVISKKNHEKGGNIPLN